MLEFQSGLCHFTNRVILNKLFNLSAPQSLHLCNGGNLPHRLLPHSPSPHRLTVMIQQENPLKCWVFGSRSRAGKYLLLMSGFFEVAVTREEPLLRASCSAASPFSDLSSSLGFELPLSSGFPLTLLASPSSDSFSSIRLLKLGGPQGLVQDLSSSLPGCPWL